MKLRTRLDAGEILIADGATGTMLMAAGLAPGTPPELWNVERPQQILALHRSYLDAGSQIILTNTFGGNRTKLSKAGIGGRVRELNGAGAALAREAAMDNAYVAGDIGPTGELMMPLGTLAYDEAVDVFAEQAAALESSGADLIWIESMMDLEEARAAVVGTREATALPVFCSLSFGPNARTIMGVSAKMAAQELWPLGLAAIGANCGEGLDVVDEVLKQMAEVLPAVPLIAKPNAGAPRAVNGITEYDMPPSDFAERMAEFVALGARIVGSCCGSGPAHISALAKASGKMAPQGQK